MPSSFRMGDGVVTQENLEEITWDWIPWETPQRWLSTMGNYDFLTANCYDKEVVELRNLLHIPCEERRK
eukprot:12922918-Prorocentrum_lima.AAC.1